MPCSLRAETVRVSFVWLTLPIVLPSDTNRVARKRQYVNQRWKGVGPGVFRSNLCDQDGRRGGYMDVLVPFAEKDSRTDAQTRQG